MRIGFVGYSAAKFDKNQAQQILDKIFHEWMMRDLYGYEEYEIVSGATYYGIPAMVYDMASKNEMKTIGVMCKEGYDCDLYPCDEIYAVGQTWGDESETFIGMIDTSKFKRSRNGKEKRYSCY